MRRLLQRQIKISLWWCVSTALAAAVATIEAVELGWYIVAVGMIATIAWSLAAIYFAWRTLQTTRHLPP